MDYDAAVFLNRALRHGGERADLFAEHTATTRLELRQHATRERVGVPSYRGWRRTASGAGVQVHAGGRRYYAAMPEPTPAALERLADQVAEAVRAGAPDATSAPVPAGEPEGPVAPSLPIALREVLRDAAEAALSLDACVRSVHVQYLDCERRTRVTVSDGTDAASTAQDTRLRLSVRYEAAGEVVEAHAIGSAEAGRGDEWSGVAHGELAREAVERARTLAAARSMPSGTMPVVIAAGWGGVWLHEAVGHLLEADTAAAAPEWLRQIGRRVAARGVTVVDDPTLPAGRGTYDYDDEGTSATPTPLIEDGVLRGFLTDYDHARRLGLPPTGNARRQDYRFAPLPRMTNLLLQAGEAEPADLLAEAGEGLYVRVIGEGVCYPGEDRFFFTVLEGYRIEQGHPTYPVTGLRVEGSTREALQHIAGIGRDFGVDHARGLCAKMGQVVPVSVGMPTMLVNGLVVRVGG